MDQAVKNLPAVQETRVQSLRGEDPWSWEWLPTPVCLPGESHGQRSLVGCSLWGRKEYTNERLTRSHFYLIYYYLGLHKLFIATCGLSLVVVRGEYSLTVVRMLLTVVASCCRGHAPGCGRVQ